MFFLLILLVVRFADFLFRAVETPLAQGTGFALSLPAIFFDIIISKIFLIAIFCRIRQDSRRRADAA
jgi:hypothetical protein